RHLAGMAFDQNTEEAFKRTANGAMHHHRLLLFRIGADIERAKTLWQVEIHLRRAALPFAADSVAQRIFEFRAVERALALIDAGLDPVVLTRHALQRAAQNVFGMVPCGIGADALFRPRG